MKFKKTGVMAIMPLTVITLPTSHVADAQSARGILGVRRVLGTCRKGLRGLFPAQVLGNPLHEAWSADGEPLDRMTPSALAKSSPSRYLIVPHSRGR